MQGRRARIDGHQPSVADRSGRETVSTHPRQSSPRRVALDLAGTRMAQPRRLLSVAHSYVVGLNRRLLAEIPRVSKGEWEVSAVAPTVFQGSRDLRPVSLDANGNVSGYRLHA